MELNFRIVTLKVTDDFTSRHENDECDIVHSWTLSFSRQVYRVETIFFLSSFSPCVIVITINFNQLQLPFPFQPRWLLSIHNLKKKKNTTTIEEIKLLARRKIHMTQANSPHRSCLTCARAQSTTNEDVDGTLKLSQQLRNKFCVKIPHETESNECEWMRSSRLVLFSLVSSSSSRSLNAIDLNFLHL